MPKVIRVHDDTDETTEMEVDVTPTCYDEEPVASYRDWKPEDTRIITVNLRAGFDRAAARRQVLREHGRIYEENHVPGRSFFRVRKMTNHDPGDENVPA